MPFSVLVGTKYEEEPPPPASELYEALSALGHKLHFTEHARTRMPLPDQAEALRLPYGVPVLQILRLTRNSDGQPLALEELHLPGNNLELTYPL